MKELTIEQKAAAYDEAITKIKYVIEHGVSPTLNKTDLENIFHELKESEDEKIRNRLISYFKSQMEARRDDSQEVLCTYSKWIAWFEKQGKVPVTINIDKMIEDYANNNERGNEEFGKPVNCMIRAYRLGITDTLSILNLENQGEQKPVISDDAIREGIAHFGITQYQIDNWLKKYVDVENQYEQKPQGKSALEAIKEERVDNANKIEPKDYSSIDSHLGKPIGPIVIRDFNSVFSREKVEEIDKRIEKSQRLYDAKLRDAMRKVEDFPMTD